METTKLIKYKNAMLLVKEMLDQNLIDKNDYKKAELFLRNKYCIKNGNLYRSFDLISTPERVMNIGEEIIDESDSKKDRRITKIEKAN